MTGIPVLLYLIGYKSISERGVYLAGGDGDKGGERGCCCGEIAAQGQVTRCKMSQRDPFGTSERIGREL